MNIILRKNQGGNNNLTPFRDTMNRLFDDALFNPLSLFGRDPIFGGQFFDSRVARAPLADVSENDKEFIVEVDAPGLSADSVDVELNNNILSVRGKAEEENEKNEKTYFIRERMLSSWERSFSLPSNVEADKIVCNVKDGKLTISIPKSESARVRKLKVSNS